MYAYFIYGSFSRGNPTVTQLLHCHSLRTQTLHSISLALFLSLLPALKFFSVLITPHTLCLCLSPSLTAVFPWTCLISPEFFWPKSHFSVSALDILYLSPSFPFLSFFFSTSSFPISSFPRQVKPEPILKEHFLIFLLKFPPCFTHPLYYGVDPFATFWAK